MCGSKICSKCGIEKLIDQFYNKKIVKMVISQNVKHAIIYEDMNILSNLFILKQ